MSTICLSFQKHYLMIVFLLETCVRIMVLHCKLVLLRGCVFLPVIPDENWGIEDSKIQGRRHRVRFSCAGYARAFGTYVTIETARTARNFAALRFCPKKALSVVDLQNQAWIDEVLALTWDEFWEDRHKGINQFTDEKISEPKTGVGVRTGMLKAFDRSPDIFRALLVEFKQQLDPTGMEDVVEVPAEQACTYSWKKRGVRDDAAEAGDSKRRRKSVRVDEGDPAAHAEVKTPPQKTTPRKQRGRKEKAPQTGSDDGKLLLGQLYVC